MQIKNPLLWKSLQTNLIFLLNRAIITLFYYSEEIFSTVERKKNIRVTDRATLFNLLIGLNGYTVCSGVIDSGLNGSNIISIPLIKEGDMR